MITLATDFYNRSNAKDQFAQALKILEANTCCPYILNYFFEYMDPSKVIEEALKFKYSVAFPENFSDIGITLLVLDSLVSGKPGAFLWGHLISDGEYEDYYKLFSAIEPYQPGDIVEGYTIINRLVIRPVLDDEDRNRLAAEIEFVEGEVGDKLG